LVQSGTPYICRRWFDPRSLYDWRNYHNHPSRFIVNFDNILSIFSIFLSGAYSLAYSVESSFDPLNIGLFIQFHFLITK
jgi:hypothetical protein